MITGRDYTAERNKLIPFAEAVATARMSLDHPGMAPGNPDHDKAWSRIFHDTMNEICRQNGLHLDVEPRVRR